jgi:hypothetical protein
MRKYDEGDGFVPGGAWTAGRDAAPILARADQVIE